MKAAIQFALAAAALAVSAPTDAQTIGRQIDSYAYAESFRDDIRGVTERSWEYVNKVDPNPRAGGVFSSSQSQSSRSLYQSPCEYGRPCYDYRFGSASSLNNVSLKAGVTKATQITRVAMDDPFVQRNNVHALNTIETSMVDRISFTGIAPGQLAVLKVTDYAQVSSGIVKMVNDPVAESFAINRFAYSSNLNIFDSLAELRKPEPVAKLSSAWRVCNSSEFPNACGTNTLSNGYLTRSRLFFVDSDDIMFIQNDLSLYSEIFVRYDMYAEGSRTVIRSFNNFGQSGYVMLEMLTPGTGYLSEFGDLYPTSLPSIPEPATWAMMIAGFGLVGAVARRRTRARQA